MPNNSDSIINRHKKYITDSQRKKLRSMYPGYRQTTADEMRDAYLQTRKAMGGVNERVSAYGLGQGYVNRKMASYKSTLSDYGRQMREASDELFERQVVNSANETIKAINEAEREKARKAAESAARKRAKAAADAAKRYADAQKKYEEDMAAYNKWLKNYNKVQKSSKNAVRSGGASKSIQTAASREYEDYLKGEYYDPRFGRAGVFGSGAIVYPKVTPRQAWNEYYDPRFADPLTGKIKPKANQGLTDYNKTPKQVKKAKQKQKSYGTVTQPEFSINPKVKPPVAPQQEKIIEEQVAEITPEQIPELTQQYLRDVNRFMLTQEKVGNSLGSLYELNDMKNNFAAAVEAARDTRLSVQERRMYANEAKQIQREYNKMRSTVNVNDASVYTQQLTPMYDALQVQRGVLQRLGVEMSDNDIAFNRSWLAGGNEMPSISEANFTMARGLMDQSPASQAKGQRVSKVGHGEFWDHIKRVKVEDSGERYASGFIKYKYGFSPEDEKWLRDNGYGWIIDNPRLQYTSNAMGSPESQYVDAVSEYLESIVGKGEGYHRALNNSRALNDVRSIPDEQLKALVAQGESKSHLTDILAEPGKYANTQVVSPGTGPNVTNPDKYLEDAAYEISKNTGIKYGIIDNPDVIRALQEDKATVAFINYCIAKGDIETANEYLYEYAEIVNAAKGQDIANAIQNAQIWGGFKEIAEHFVQLGYGVSTFFTGLEDLFASYKEPTRAGEYMSSQITQNKVSRGWNPFWAKAIDSATVSTGRQLPAIALSYAGGAIGEAVGGLTGVVASHAGTIAMGASSAGTAKMEALREGYGTDAATAYGILNGISETVLQEAIGGIVGLGGHGAFTKALEKTVNSIKSPAGRVVATQALDALSEITQEEFGDIFENINRSVTLGEKRGLFDGVADQAGETAISTAISTLLLNALHIPAQLRTERGYSAIAKAANMSVSEAKFLLDTEAAIKDGDNVNPKDIERYNELTAVLTAAMPDDIVKAIADCKMTVSDWVTSTEGVVQGKLTGKPDSTSKSTAGIYIEKGEIPKRDINVPVSVKEGMKTSKLARTIAEAVESDEFAEELLNEVYDGLMSYTPDVNKSSMDKALGKLKDNMSAAVTEWNAAVNKNRVLTPDDVALGAALLHSAAESGNFNEAMEIASQLQDQATKGGKLVQSFRMIKRLGAAGALYYINRQMSKINAELEAAAKGYKLKLNPDLVQRLLNAKDYHEIREAVEAIRKDLGEQLHPTLRDWLTAWRYTAMLGNFRTLIRNDIGNAGFIPVVTVKNVLNNAIQGGVQLVSGGRFQKTTKLFASKAYRDFAAWDWNDSTKYDIKGNKYNEEANAIKDYMRYDLHVPKGLKPGAWVFEKWRKGTQFAMEDEKALGDMAFKKAHYQYALATRLERAGVDLEALKNVLTRSRNGEVFVSGSKDEQLLNTYNKAAEYARNEANRNTYNDVNAFASFISQISKRMYDYETESGKHPLRAGHYLLEGILPFKNTPANIISRATEYSPIGLARTIVLDTGRLIKSVKKGDGKMTGEMFIENIAKGLTGSMLFALGAILAKAGILRGGLGYDDKEDKELRRKGHQSYSLEIGDQSITLDWLAPECIPLFMGVELFNELGNMSAEAWDEKGLKALLNVTTGAYEPMLNMSMLQGVNELFTGFQSSDDLGGLTKVLATVGTSYLTQFQPTLLAQLARSIDPNVRTTYIDKNSKLPPFLQRFWQQSAKKVPGLSYLVPKKVDEMGNEVLQNAGVVGVLEQFLSPAYRKTLTDSPVDQKIAELGVDAYPSAANKYVTYKGEKYNLTASEFEAYAATRGQIAGMMMEALMNDEAFNSLSDVDQVKAFGMAYEYGDTVAKSTILGMKGILGDTSPGALESWVGKANRYAEKTGSENTLPQFIAIRQGLNAAGITNRDSRADYLWNMNIPARNKALIMEAFDGSNGGYAEGSVFYNKNGKVLYDFAEAKPETVAEAPAEEITQISTATEVPAATAAPSPTPAPTATPDPYSEAVSSVKKMNSADAFAYLNTTKYSSEEKYQILAKADKNDPKAKAAQSFHSSYGLSYDDMWDVQTKYDSTSFHGYDFQKYVDKKGVKSRQKFALVELANSQSAWLERAEEVNKEMGISYDILWKVKLYWSGESGRGKKERITKYAKSLGLKQSQIDKLYDKYKFLT